MYIRIPPRLDCVCVELNAITRSKSEDEIILDLIKGTFR